MILSKRQIKLLAFVDIIVGFAFLILTLLAFLVISTLWKISSTNLSLFDFILNFLIVLLMLVSGYILIESKHVKSARNAVLTGWLISIFGIIILISTLNMFFNGRDANSFMYFTGLLVNLISFSLMIISGYYLRKLC